jgi:hypothetical protein
MAIATGAQPTPTVAPQAKIPFVDTQTGLPATTSVQFMQQLYGLVNAMNRIVPCNCTNSGNVYTLTVLSASPVYKGYSSYDQFPFVASASSTGSVTALVMTNSGALATLNVYKANGATQAGNGDITINLQYFLTYVDTLNSNAGGFVLR